MRINGPNYCAGTLISSTASFATTGIPCLWCSPMWRSRSSFGYCAAGCAQIAGRSARQECSVCHRDLSTARVVTTTTRTIPAFNWAGLRAAWL